MLVSADSNQSVYTGSIATLKQTPNWSGNMTAIERATVLGSGAGALTIAAELGLAGTDVTLADLPSFGNRLDPVADAGGVRAYRDRPHLGVQLGPITATSNDPAAAIPGAPS